MTRPAAAALARTVRGDVFTPGQTGYADHCASFNANHPLEPAIVVAAATAGDVAHAVRFARAEGLPVAVNATSHHVVHAARGGLLVATSGLADVTVDADRRTARVDAGVRWQQVLDEAGKAGLAPVAGSAPAVGVVGYTLGGGLSPVLSRSLGYAADHVRRIELVIADGEQRVATAEEEPDLFWALRGGLGNFGVVTAMEFDLFPHPRFHGGGLYFPGADAAAVLHRWREWAPSLPEEATTSVMLQRLPPLPALPEPLRGAFVVHLRFAFLGTPEDGERLLAPMRAVAPVVLDLVGDKPFPAIGEVHLDPVDPIPHHSAAESLAGCGPDVVDALLELAGPDAECPLLGLEVRALGGALDRPPAVPNAVPSRGVPYLVFGLGVGGPDRADELTGYLARVSAELAPWTLPRRAPTFLLGADVSEDRVRAAYGPEYPRLAAIKERFDPSNAFRFTHNIPPATTGAGDPPGARG